MSNLLLLLILLPAAAALVCYLVRSSAVRKLTVVATGAILTLASLGLLAQGTFEPVMVGSFLGINALLGSSKTYRRLPRSSPERLTSASQ